MASLHANGTADRGDASQNQDDSNIENGTSRRLTDEEFDRYSRQMIVPGMGKEGENSRPPPTPSVPSTNTPA